MDKFKIILIVTLFIQDNLGRRYDTEIKQNTDFLIHEAIGTNNGGKRDYVAPQTQYEAGKGNDYNSQFPPLGRAQVTPKTTTSLNPLQNTGSLPSGKRDYVNPNLPLMKPSLGLSTPSPTQSLSGKRDPFPPLGSLGTTPKTAATVNINAQTTGKRDYVNPNYPTLKPVPNQLKPQQQTGKVKDLINFFGGNTTPTQKTPSYSMILNGGNNVKPNGITNTGVTLNKPSTPASVTMPQSNKRPSTPVLPSTIVNNNNNNRISNSNTFTDADLQIISEELLRKDVNNAAKYLTINYQEKTSSSSKEDKAARPLFTVGAEVWNIPTIQKLLPLLDNYERDTLVNEYVTPQERNEENAFMDTIMNTSVIRYLLNMLKEKGYVSPDPKQQRDFLKQLWFSLYSRGKGKISSSGFEHIFVSELKNGEVSGLHNWIYFAKEEAANRINYLGYLKYAEISDKGAVMKLHFNQQGVDKPVNTMFVGTSPELEIAIYTLCFVTRADNDCNLKFANKDINIVTHTFRYRSKNLIGSAYPQIV